MNHSELRRWVLAAVLLVAAATAAAHGLVGGDARFVAANHGLQMAPYLYLGAKHMVTGYDHLLFLVGVVFFLNRLRDVALYVTLFAIGHSATLLLGVLAQVQLNAYLVDSLIGLSVVYKGFENLGGFSRLGWRLGTRAAVLLFGLAHGFGLATKLQALHPTQDGLIGNIISFNLGVEIGQFLALALVLMVLGAWRRSPSFQSTARVTNVLLMTAGFMLMGYHLIGYALTRGSSL
jgi:hypothetical protein